MIVDGVGSYRSDVMEAFPASDTATPLARESESYYKFSGTTLECLKKVWMEPDRGFLSDEFYNMPGLGALYSRASTYIFGDWNKCGELMGLAPYGRRDQVKHLLEMNDGKLHVPHWTAEFKQPYVFDAAATGRSSPAMRHWEDLAWRTQDDTENVLLARARWLRETTGAKNLCMAGGVALNCVANGRVAREAGFENVWIQPAAGDDGIAIGCAYYGWLEILKQRRDFVMDHSYVGRRYSDQEAADANCRNSWCVSRSTPSSSDNVCRDTAKLLADQKVIGWFQDRSEFGPRALGNRSLIADPRKPEMKDILNSRVKHRQAFRPFAPIVLAERMKEIFEGDEDSPFMLIAKPVRPEWRDKIPAIVHVDGTARVQTVREATNPMLYRLLKEFEALTGVPVLINTSFNIKGEPIVETPQDAVNCFLTTGDRPSGHARHDGLEERDAQGGRAAGQRLRRRADAGGLDRAAGLNRRLPGPAGRRSGGFRRRRLERLVLPLRPGNVIGDDGHDRDAGHADEDLRKQRARTHRQLEMPDERQEHADAEHGERLLAADDQRIEHLPLQPRPVLRHEADDQDHDHDEVQEAIGREVGLVVRVERRIQPVREHARRKPETCRPWS